MISLPKSFAPIVQVIKDNPNNKNPVLWASWLIPTVITPLARYAADSERNKNDRIGLSLEMFTLYTIGTILYFTFNPIAGLMTKRLFRQKSENFHNLAGGITGSLVSALFSGFYSNRLGDRLKQGLGLQSNTASKGISLSAVTKPGLDEISYSPSFRHAATANQFRNVSSRQAPNFGHYTSFQMPGTIRMPV
jgi:hypothetical protein